MKRPVHGIWIVVLFLSSACAEPNRDAEKPSVARLLQEADRLAWLTDWYSALPLYTAAEKAARDAGDERNAMYARFGRLRGQMQTLPLADVSDQLATDLATSLAQSDRRLQLRGLTVKGDIDLEWNVEAAQRDWEQVRQIAQDLGEKAWANRATGELGLVAFMRGNTGEAQKLVEQAFRAAWWSRDIGSQLRYMGAISNGLLHAGYPQRALEYADKAIAFAGKHPETGFPYVAYSTKVLTLMRLNRFDDADQLAQVAMAEAKAGDRRIKQVELLMMLAKIAQQRGQHDRVIPYLEQAVGIAQAGHIRRLLGDAEEELAKGYRSAGDLEQAARHARAAVEDSQAAGNRFTLPGRLSALADIYAAQGKLDEADRTYAEATDIVEGIMVNVPTSTAQARLIGVMSNLYTGHFRVAVARRSPVQAYNIIERARGRAIADVLRTLPDRAQRLQHVVDDQARTVSQLQVRLMTALGPAERQELLDQLWDAEQRLLADDRGWRGHRLAKKDPIAFGEVQRNLKSDEVILEFLLDEPHSYCLVISRRHARLVSLPSRKQIEELATAFTQELRRVNGDQSGPARRLNDSLIKPIALSSTVRRLYVVPDGRLHLIPFDALLGVDLVAERAITIVPSATVFVLLRTAPTAHPPARPLLAIGGVPYDRTVALASAAADSTRSDRTRGLYDVAKPWKLAPLASTETEVSTAASLLGKDSVVLTGEQATETKLKALNLADFRIVHFAVHGITDPKNPERTALVLLADPRAGEDGLLQPREIGGLTLNADLVVLSACDTAVGPTVGQEGTLNLARAFLLAGARSVLTTLWTVSDATSTALMKRFYENLASGLGVVQALAAAKKAVLSQFGPPAAPTLAAFQIVGDGDHLKTKRVDGAHVTAQRAPTLTLDDNGSDSGRHR